MKTPDCVLDGEVCALDEQGRRASRRCSRASRARRSSTTSSTLLELDGEPLVDLPLVERRERLAALLDQPQPDRPRSRRRSTTARRCSRRRRQQSSRGSSPSAPTRAYLPGQAHARLAEDQDARPPGVRDRRLHEGPGPARAGGSARSILGVWRGDELELRRQRRHRASPTTEIGELLAKLQPLERDGRRRSASVPKMPKVRQATDVVWVEPKLVAEVEFAEWTHDGRLRAPSYQGLREDKAAREVHREEPFPDEIRSGSARAQALEPRQGLLAGRGHHEGRPARATTARSRRSLIPHLRDRPFTMKRYPDGIGGAVLLPEGRADAHARLDPDARARGRRARAPRRDADDRRRRSSTTSSRCSGW